MLDRPLCIVICLYCLPVLCSVGEKLVNVSQIGRSVEGWQPLDVVTVADVEVGETVVATVSSV